jgi:hypothetical protein
MSIGPRRLRRSFPFPSRLDAGSFIIGATQEIRISADDGVFSLSCEVIERIDHHGAEIALIVSGEMWKNLQDFGGDRQKGAFCAGR